MINDNKSTEIKINEDESIIVYLLLRNLHQYLKTQ